MEESRDMANSKKRCRNCKSYKLTESMININGAYFCNINGATTYAFKNKEKGKKIKHVAQKKNFQLSDLKIRKAAAVTACHLYIRTRDKGKNCITCPNPLTGKYDAGHFMNGTNSYTKFMEKNIHGQCVNCNQYNGGREREYEHVLIAKYGKFTVLALKRLRTRKIKRTANDYLLIEKHFKQKLKMLE